MSDDNVPYEPKRPAVAPPGAPLPESAGKGPDALPGQRPPPEPEPAPSEPEAATEQGSEEGGDERGPETYGTGEPDRALEFKIIEALQTVYDPEIPVNIYDMGLIYEIRVDTEGSAYIKMTLTSPSCPVAGTLPGEVEEKARSVEKVEETKVELVWDPPWSMDLLSDAARLELNL